ncbi:MAG: type VI secretion system ImpA family N-terminal domain-containing protein [Paracoccaceae bacterium]
MKLEPLLQPLSDELPCGNDLKNTKDPDFVGVFLASSGRLPREYIRRGGIGGSASDVVDTPIDPTTIDFRGEARHLDGLLTRSRDLRFLTLRAQWAALAGNLKELVDAIAACAALLETFGDRVPPFKADDRKRALAGLNNNHTMVLPLQFYDLTEANSVTLRRVRVAEDDTPG